MKNAFVLKSLVVIALAIYPTQTYAQRYFENVTWLVLAAEDRLDHPQEMMEDKTQEINYNK